VEHEAGAAGGEAGGFSLVPHVVFHLLGIPITASVFSAYLVSAIVVLVIWLGTRHLQLVPGRFQSLLELGVEALLNMCVRTAGERRGRRFLPIVATAFFFIVSANWLGITPPFGDITWLHSPNADLNIPLAMAVIVFVYVQYSAIRANGLFGYLKEFVYPLPILHLFTELGRPVSLSLRLFGNILAGEVLLLVFRQLVPVVVPGLFMLFELFVGVVQALIFALLTLAFLSIATQHEHEPGTEHAPGAH